MLRCGRWQLVHQSSRLDVRQNWIISYVFQVVRHPVNHLVSVTSELFVIHFAHSLNTLGHQLPNQSANSASFRSPSSPGGAANAPVFTPRSRAASFTITGQGSTSTRSRNSMTYFWNRPTSASTPASNAWSNTTISYGMALAAPDTIPSAPARLHST